MKYFLHDTNSFEDEKITELFMAFGYEGLGLFYTILEKLAKQEKPVKTTVLKKQLSVGKRLNKCWSFLEDLQLISSNNGDTFNNNLLKFSEKYQVSKEKNREKVSQWREKQTVKDSVTGYVPVRNAPKVKESKVKELVDKSTMSIRSERDAKEHESFADFWLAYPRKESKASAQKSFAKLTQDEQAGAADAAREWFGRKADWIGSDGTDYRPHPDTWLNKKRWQDLTEITITQNPTPHGQASSTVQSNGNFQQTRTAPSKFEYTDTESLRASILLLKSVGL